MILGKILTALSCVVAVFFWVEFPAFNYHPLLTGAFVGGISPSMGAIPELHSLSIVKNVDVSCASPDKNLAAGLSCRFIQFREVSVGYVDHVAPIFPTRPRGHWLSSRNRFWHVEWSGIKAVSDFSLDCSRHIPSWGAPCVVDFHDSLKVPRFDNFNLGIQNAQISTQLTPGRSLCDFNGPVRRFGDFAGGHGGPSGKENCEKKENGSPIRNVSLPFPESNKFVRAFGHLPLGVQIGLSAIFAAPAVLAVWISWGWFLFAQTEQRPAFGVILFTARLVGVKWILSGPWRS